MISIPKTLVRLGRAVELQLDDRRLTWSKRDNWIVASCPRGTTVFLFQERRRRLKNPRCKTGMVVQSYLFDRSNWDNTSATHWLRDHGAKSPKPDITDRFLHYRQLSPKLLWKLRTKIFDKQRGIKAIVGCFAKKQRVNPSKSSSAHRLFSSFNHHPPDGELSLTIATPTMRICRATSIVYESDKSGGNAEYIHTFVSKPWCWTDKKNRPTIIMLRGRLRITSRGIEG